MLLQSVIGSHMHDLNGEHSDVDTRSVVASPLVDFLDPFARVQTTHKIDDKDDHVVYELQHFLRLLAKGSPSVIDVVYAPNIRMFGKLSEELVHHRTSFIDKTAAVRAFQGYAENMKANASNGIRPEKSLRSAILTGCVIDACLRDIPYDPLTYPVRQRILNYSRENEGTYITRLHQELNAVLYYLAKRNYTNHFDSAYVKEYCYRVYMKGVER